MTGPRPRLHGTKGGRRGDGLRADFFRKQLDGLRRDGNYRVFADLQRGRQLPPATHVRERGRPR